MTADADWPVNAWTLSAPESYVLQHGPQADGGDAFKLAVLELVARGALRLVEVEERRSFGRTRKASVLAPGPKPLPPAAQALASVWLLYSGIALQLFGDVAGVPVAELAKAAVRRYKSLDRYRFEEIVAPLVDRRLFAREEYRILWIWPAQRIVITPAGAAMRADLEQRLELGKNQFGDWVDRDPSRAVAFLGLAGASLLLMNPIYPDLQRLQRQVGQPTTSDTSTTSMASSSSGSGDGAPRELAPDTNPAAGDPSGLGLPGIPGLPELPELPELPGMPDLSNLGIDLSGLAALDFDLSALDGLDSAFDAIDSAVDSGSGDSGGDSGGGDSGGSDGGGSGE